MDESYLDVEEFKRKQQDFQANKDGANALRGALSGIGGMLQAESNVPSAYEYLYNKKMAPTDFQGGMDRAAKFVQDPTDPADREQKALAYMKARREGNLAQEQDAISMAKKDPNSKQSMALKALAPRWGIKVSPDMSASDIEQMIDPKKMMETEAMSATQFENAKKLKKMELAGELAKVNAQKNTPKGQFDQLPEDKKLTISELAKKNAFKQSIANQIDAVMSHWDDLPDDQKVARGRQLLKTLNSTEGSDAVGASEAAMLGSKLEFALGNLTNSQPMQFGRDLPGFKAQAMGTSQAIKDAIAANQAQIDSAYGRAPVVNAKTQPKTPQNPRDQQAMQWALSNPGDPRSKEILTRLGVDANTAIGQR